MTINVENLVGKIRDIGSMEQSVSTSEPTSHKEELVSIQESLLTLIIQINGILGRETQTKDPPLT